MNLKTPITKMSVQQISVFIENRYGKLEAVLRTLSDANIQIIASMVSDTVDYGIFRMLTTDPTRAVAVLKEANISAKLSEVYVFQLTTQSGALLDLLTPLIQSGISINYMYGASVQATSFAVIALAPLEEAAEAIRRTSIRTISQEGLNAL